MGAKNIPLNYLLFDDDTTAEEKYRQEVTIRGCTCNIIYINPLNFYNAEINKFNKEDFISCIETQTRGKEINLIATDWHIFEDVGSSSTIYGWDIIEYVIEAKSKFKDKVFLIYSSNMSDVIKYMNEKREEGKNINDFLNDFTRKALELKINFTNRNEDVSQKIRDLLSRNNTISNIVLDTIQSYHKNTIINMGDNYFKDRKISDILNNDTNLMGIKFIRELIELSIANFTELNDE
ncbi:hypothetical protein [Capnocytophaga gingivalis]